MTEYEYLEHLDCATLTTLIREMLDFDETTRALMQLEEKEPETALELGKDILLYNQGDDYLQATVWNILYDDHPADMIEAICKRKEEVGKALLLEIIFDFKLDHIVPNEHFPQKIREGIQKTAHLKDSRLLKYQDLEEVLSHV